MFLNTSPCWPDHYAQADHGLLAAALPADFLTLSPCPEAIGLAVSGGSDSMAMLHLLSRAVPHLAAAGALRLEVATVDHRLRPEAAAEADFVASVAAGLGHRHEVLAWTDHPASGNLMQEASRARYDLLAAWAGQRGLGHICLAHTEDDQAETFLMGLSRASGLDGLTGMRPWFDHGGIRFWRPFLGETRAALRGFLSRHGLTWCEDPSNEDDRYSRARIRKSLPLLAPAGITAATLARTVRNLAPVQDLLRRMLAEAFDSFGSEAAGGLSFRRAAFAASPPELQRRLLLAAIRWLSGARHPPRAEALSACLCAILDGRGGTLGGSLIRVTKREIRITREPGAVSAPCPPDRIWDHRWRLSGPAGPGGESDQGTEIGALGPAGLRAFPDWRASGFSRDALLTSPAVRQAGRLIAAPVLQPGAAGWRAELCPGFRSFILSH